MTLLIIRHGQDLPNHRGGWSYSGLTNEGKQQSHKLGIYLKKQKISCIVSSDLPRSKETADIINQYLGIPIEYLSEWREINSGLLSGMSKKESDEKYPGFYIEKIDIDKHFPNGESPREFYERIISALTNLQQRFKHNETVALVTHGGVIMALLHYFEGLDWINDRQYLKVEKCSVSTAIFEYDEWKLIKKDDNSYNRRSL